MADLRTIMLEQGVSPHTAEAVLLAYTAARKQRKEPDAIWGALLSKAKAARLNITSNRPKRVGNPVAPLYEEYYDLICSAIAKIEEASLLLLDDGKPVQPKDLEAKRAQTNKRRAEEGKPLLAECMADAWHTWIAPQTRADFQEKVRQFYANSNATRKGGRFTPFVLQADKTSLTNATNKLLQDLTEHRTLHKMPEAPDNGKAWGSTRYSALQLRMVAEGFKELRLYGEAVRDGRIDPLIDPPPKDWRMLLSGDFRARLRAADANPPATELTDYEERNFLAS